jgi:Fic family protein
LYLSLFFKTHRSQYYDLLQLVREKGDWEAWLRFFLEGVTETSTQAANAAREILNLFEEDRRMIESLGRPTASALRVHQLFQTHPILSVQAAAGRLKLSIPTVRKSIRHLEDLKILREATGKRRDRIFAYQRYLTILNRGTEPLAS